jgi:hypothetical protein
LRPMPIAVPRPTQPRDEIVSMTRPAWAWAAAASIALAAGVGCYSPAPYQPYYGQPAYPVAPGTYPAAPGAMPAAPGGGYVVPGTVPGSLGAPSMSPSGPTLAPPLNGSGTGTPPTFAPGSTPAGPSVPEYRAPGSDDFEYNNGRFGPAPDDGFRPPADNGSPFYEGTAAPRRLDIEQANRRREPPDYLAGLDDFEGSHPSRADFGPAPRASVRPAGFVERPTPNPDFGFDPITGPDPAESNPAEEETLDYDRTGYRWLRGVVDFDPRRRNWHIIYGLPPDPADRYGGSLTLLDDGHLADLQDNDVVFLEGRLDPTAGRDLLGKPLYRVTHAKLLGRFE